MALEEWVGKGTEYEVHNGWQVESTQGLRDILITIDRYSSLEQHYTRVRMRPLRRLWDEFESAKAGLPLAKTSTTENQPGTDRRPPSTAISVKGPAMSFVEWLPHFYDEILLVLEQELKWYVKLPFELT
jgi:hypothetical protein